MKKKTNIEKKKHASHLQVLEGGKSAESEYTGNLFISAEATNTRLMGVVGLHTHYAFGEDQVHQFFYFDAEEYGFDDYNGFATKEGEGESEIEAIKTQMFGALGGQWVSLSEKEALYLIGYYAAFNLERDIEFPDEITEYAWLIEAASDVTEEDAKDLMSKICVKLRSHYEIINYYLMRCCGQDLTALRHLCTEEGMVDVISPSSPATLFKNDITPADGTHTYRAVSLVEEDDKFSNYVSILTVSKGKVTSARQVSLLPISTWEASLILKKSEYIIHAKYDGDKQRFHELMDLIFPAFTHSAHMQGDLYVIYAIDNSHVRKANYRLDEDTLAVVLALDSGELVIEGHNSKSTSGTAAAIALATKETGREPLEDLGHYHFGDPIMGLFLESGLTSFSEFLDIATSTQDDE